MASFQVTPSDLTNLASGLSQLVGELQQAGNIHPDASAAGHPRAVSAIESFFAEWSDGLRQVQSNLAAISTRLTAAGDAYAAVESKVVAAFE